MPNYKILQKKKTTKMMGIGYESKSFISFSLHNSMYH